MLQLPLVASEQGSGFLLNFWHGSFQLPLYFLISDRQEGPLQSMQTSDEAEL